MTEEEVKPVLRPLRRLKIERSFPNGHSICFELDNYTDEEITNLFGLYEHVLSMQLEQPKRKDIS